MEKQQNSRSINKPIRTKSANLSYSDDKLNEMFSNLDSLLQTADAFSKFINVKEKRNEKNQKKRGNIQNDNNFNDNENYLTHQPKILKGGKLKSYQLEALNWMISLYESNLNGILADDMGLGKTIQTISFFGYLREFKKLNGKHLIIAPLTTLNNWVREIKKWLPDSRVVMLLATEKQRQAAYNEYIKEDNFDILVTSYEGSKYAFNRIYKKTYISLIIDEAHKIKNDQSQISQTLKLYKAQFKLLLTGTPLSNKLHQLWALLNFILPDIFNDVSLFDDMSSYVQSLEGEQKHRNQDQIARKFHRIINPFLKRRTKKQVEKQLPPKFENSLYISLTPLQISMYKNQIKYSSVYGNVKSKFLNNQVQLRKVCCHPYLFPDIEAKDAQPLGEHLITSSGKMIALDKLAKKFINQGHKILIFSQFTTMLDIIQDYCNYRQYKYCRIDGTTNIMKREEQMHTFNTNFDYKIFLLSTRSGGLGINLVSADMVIIYDIDWNPQIDNQAMDRAYRIGQDKQVHVFKFICEFTVEERMSEIQKIKLIWDELVIQNGSLFMKGNNTGVDIIDYDKISKLGKGEIFKIQANLTNEDIDDLIKRGQQKDQNKKEKFKKVLVQKLGSSTFNKFDLYGMIEAQHKTQVNQNDLSQVDYDEQIGNYLQKRKKKIVQKKTKTLPQYHFYSADDRNQYIDQIRKLENCRTQFQKQQIRKRIQDIMNRGFLKWNSSEVDRFIQANLKYKKHQYGLISKQIGTKTIQQVEEYSKAFFSFASYYGTLKKKYRQIIKNQEDLEKQQKKFTLLAWMRKNIKSSEQIELSAIQYEVLNFLDQFNGSEDLQQLEKFIKSKILMQLNIEIMVKDKQFFKKRLQSVIAALEIQKWKREKQVSEKLSQKQEKKKKKFQSELEKAYQFFGIDAPKPLKQITSLQKSKQKNSKISQKKQINKKIVSESKSQQKKKSKKIEQNTKKIKQQKIQQQSKNKKRKPKKQITKKKQNLSQIDTHHQ